MTLHKYVKTNKQTQFNSFNTQWLQDKYYHSKIWKGRIKKVGSKQDQNPARQILIYIALFSPLRKSSSDMWAAKGLDNTACIVLWIGILICSCLECLFTAWRFPQMIFHVLGFSHFLDSLLSFLLHSYSIMHWHFTGILLTSQTYFWNLGKMLHNTITFQALFILEYHVDDTYICCQLNQ